MQWQVGSPTDLLLDKVNDSYFAPPAHSLGYHLHPSVAYKLAPPLHLSLAFSGKVRYTYATNPPCEQGVKHKQIPFCQVAEKVRTAPNGKNARCEDTVSYIY